MSTRTHEPLLKVTPAMLAVLGLLEAVLAATYFTAVLLYLQPLKKAARAASIRSRTARRPTPTS